MPENTTIYDSIFGNTPAVQAAAAARDASFQDWLNQRRQAVEQQRTDNVKMARLNALGNVLTTMVQPLGWAVGGKSTGVTGGVQPVDNRQYLDSFTRAMKAADDLRNIGTLEGEYQFKLADENYRRQLALEDEQRRQELALQTYEQRANLDLEKQKQIYDLRSQLSQQQMEERIKVAEATAKAKFKFSTRGGGKVAESVRDNLLKRANTAYAQILADYYKKRQIGIENLQEPPTYDEFLRKFASENGYNVSETQGEGNNNTSSSAKPAEKKGGFQTGNNTASTNTSTTAGGKKGGFQK